MFIFQMLLMCKITNDFLNFHQQIVCITFYIIKGYLYQCKIGNFPILRILRFILKNSLKCMGFMLFKIHPIMIGYATFSNFHA